MSRILVIDDEDIVRISCERTLIPEGYSLKVVASGHEGLGCLEKEPYNLVLLDLKMPDMDGMEVLEKIRKSWPDTKVIMITGYSTSETAAHAKESGAASFIEKPFTPDTLLEMVRETLKK